MKNIVISIAFGIMAAGAAMAGTAQIGYGEGQVDRSAAEAVAATGNAVIVGNTLYAVGYDEGEIDPRLARAIR